MESPSATIAVVKGRAAAADADADVVGVGDVVVVVVLFEHAATAARTRRARAVGASLLLIIPEWMRVWVILPSNASERRHEVTTNSRIRAFNPGMPARFASRREPSE